MKGIKNQSIIVKFDQFFVARIFTDDDIAFCKFDTYTLEVDISSMTEVDISVLFDLFEECFSDEYFQLLELYEKKDYLFLAKDCLAKIPDKSVRRFCLNIYKQLEMDDINNELDDKVQLLNQLLSNSNLDPNELPTIEEECVYHAKRNLFVSRNKWSSKTNKIYRFTIAKKVYEFLREGNYSVRLELINEKTKILFHVSVKDKDFRLFDRVPLLSESRALFSNNDGSLRVNLPPLILENLIKADRQVELFITLRDDEILFSLFEEMKITNFY